MRTRAGVGSGSCTSWPDVTSTPPQSPATTGKIGRFHRTPQAQFGTGRQFVTLIQAQDAPDQRVASYNTDRPHRSRPAARPRIRQRFGHVGR
ncbi:integrase core domain-containing protein [Cellulomonas olei]